MKNAAVIVAGGKGKRMGTDISKQFIEVNGKPILAYTIEKFTNSNLFEEIIVVLPQNQLLYFEKKIKDRYFCEINIKITEGGAERQESVFNGLKMVDKNTDIVVIHDGVRPFIKIEDIVKTIKLAQEKGACVLGVPVKDTIKVCDINNNVINTPDRKTLWAIQTPQTFKYNLIMDAYIKAQASNFIGTDDASVAENAGYEVIVAEGSYDNIKITTKEDLIYTRELQ